MTGTDRIDELAKRFDAKTARERIEQLAELDAVTYEMQRKDAAEKLGMRAAALDKLVKRQALAKLAGRAIVFADPEPCAEPVSTSALLDELTACLRRYIVLPAHAQAAVSLWTLHSWVLDASQLSPLLAIQSPQKRCGKSHLLMLLGEMVYRPLVATNVTPAALFRTVEAHAPTLLLDEADTWLRDNDELRGLTNAGHTRKTAFTLRVVGDDFEPHRFSTWCAKAIAGIGTLKDTLEDRSIIIHMRRRAPGETVEALRFDRIQAPVPAKFARWRQDNLDRLRGADPEVPAELNDRAADNWSPLLAIAALAGDAWAAKARAAALALSDEKDEDTLAVELLRDIRGAFAEARVDRLPSASLVEKLIALEDRPWRELNRGKPLSPHKLARMLAPFDVRPATRRDGAYTFKGYLQSSFEDAFTRYTPSQTVTPSQSSNDAASSRFQTVTRENHVTVSKPLQANNDAGCDGVTVSGRGESEIAPILPEDEHALEASALERLHDAQTVDELEAAWAQTVIEYQQRGVPVPLAIEACWHECREALSESSGDDIPF